SSQYLLGLIEEILETSRINSGKIVSVAAAEKEDDVLDSVVTIVSEQMKEARLDFNFEAKGCKGRYVLMDAQHVKRVLLNLISNSIKFTPEGGKVSLIVNVKYDENRVRHEYHVIDNGIGISESFQRKMYLPFEQDPSVGESNEGAGLGLYIARNLVELMGGNIAYRRRESGGTEFIVTLNYDLATDEQISLRPHRAETYEDQVLYGKNVLLAEDNHIIAEVIMKILNTKGIHAELATDGQDALELFRSHGPYHYQAILMDLMMPVKDGIETAAAIRGLETVDARSVTIIALTGDVTDGVERRCKDAGMNYCIGKPVDPGKLFNCLVEGFQTQMRDSGTDENK
ncbi:MAG: response regulator, partial [Blautia sp.]|nr:response regulator [Blautia sp.]